MPGDPTKLFQSLNAARRRLRAEGIAPREVEAQLQDAARAEGFESTEALAAASAEQERRADIRGAVEESGVGKGRLGALLTGLAQGVPFSGDIAGLVAHIPGGLTPEQARETTSAVREQAFEEHPLISIAGQLAPALAAPGAAGLVRGVLPKIGLLAGEGALFGAGTGDPTASIGERARDAAVGGALGGGIGAAGAGIARGVQRFAPSSRLAKVFRETPRDVLAREAGKTAPSTAGQRLAAIAADTETQVAGTLRRMTSTADVGITTQRKAAQEAVTSANKALNTIKEDLIEQTAIQPIRNAAREITSPKRESVMRAVDRLLPTDRELAVGDLIEANKQLERRVRAGFRRGGDQLTEDLAGVKRVVEDVLGEQPGFAALNRTIASTNAAKRGIIEGQKLFNAATDISDVDTFLATATPETIQAWRQAAVQTLTNKLKGKSPKQVIDFMVKNTERIEKLFPDADAWNDFRGAFSRISNRANIARGAEEGIKAGSAQDITQRLSPVNIPIERAVLPVVGAAAGGVPGLIAASVAGAGARRLGRSIGERRAGVIADALLSGVPPDPSSFVQGVSGLRSAERVARVGGLLASR